MGGASGGQWGSCPPSVPWPCPPSCPPQLSFMHISKALPWLISAPTCSAPCPPPFAPQESFSRTFGTFIAAVAKNVRVENMMFSYQDIFRLNLFLLSGFAPSLSPPLSLSLSFPPSFSHALCAVL